MNLNGAGHSAALMSTGNQKRSFFNKGGVLLTGVVVSQIIGFFIVSQSNHIYDRMLTLVHGTGYLTVPNPIVQPALERPVAAFNGGLFFTLTVGLFVTLWAMIGAWAWVRVTHRHKPVLISMIAAWTGLMVWANADGFVSEISLYLLLVPPPVFWMTQKYLAKPEPAIASRRPELAVLLGFLLTGLLLSGSVKPELFLDIRDNLLLSSRIGRYINAFYYENSLFSANVFKSLDQQLFRTCTVRLKNSAPQLERRLKAVLLANDYLPIPTNGSVDLNLIVQREKVIFRHRQNVVLSVTTTDFLQKPAEALSKFANVLDHKKNFRRLTFLALLFNGSVMLYGVALMCLYGIFRLILKPTASLYTAIVICLALSLGWALYQHFRGTSPAMDGRQLTEALTAESSARRLSALKVLSEKKGNLAPPSVIVTPAVKRDIVERYWLAKALGTNPSPAGHEVLRRLLKDPQFNVVCMAIDALGRSGNRRDIPVILEKIRTSSNWYEQWYAYKALRRLGWRQRMSG